MTGVQVSELCGPRIHYELFQVGHDILLPVEPAALNKLHRLTGILQVGRCRCRDEVTKVGKILAASC